MSVSSVDRIKEFARKSGREVVYNEQAYPPVPPSNITYHKRTLYIPNGNSYFICFANSKELGPQGVFSGVFIPIDLPNSFQVVFRKKDILDKLNLLQRKKFVKSGIPGIDSKISIQTNEQAIVKRMLQERNMQHRIKNGLDSADAMLAGVNHMEVDFVPGLKARSHFGIYTQMTWFEDASIIEKLFQIITE